MATITDVAKRAGVSIATVSYVLNGRTDLVRQETAERIRKAAQELSYSASPMARGLATGSSYTVAVVLPDHSVFSHPIGSQEFLGVAEEFYMSNYSMLIKPSYADSRRMKMPAKRIPGHVAGLLVLGPMSLDNPDLLEARTLRKPTVVVEDVPGEWGVTCVNADNYAAAQMVAGRMVGNGHRRIALLSHKTASACMDKRIAGYCDALRAAGVEVDQALLFDTHTHHVDEIRGLFDDMMDRDSRPTALVVLNSALMPGVAEGVAVRALRVPEDLEIGCVDYGMPANFKIEWPVVTLSHDLRRQGELAARTLIEMLKNKETRAENHYILPELCLLQP